MMKISNITLVAFCVFTLSAVCLAQTPELIVETGHSGEVASVAISPDGRTLASGSWDKTVKLWDRATGQGLRTLRDHSDRVTCVAFSPDGRVLASGSYDRSIKLLDVFTGKLVLSLDNSSIVESVVFSPDGRILASSGESLKLWDVSTGRLISSFGSGRRDDIAFSPDGRTLISSGLGPTIWSVTTGTELRRFDQKEAYPEFFNFVALSPNGKVLAGGSFDDAVKLWDAETGRLLHSFKVQGGEGALKGIVFSPDGKTLASVGTAIQLWDVATATELRRWHDGYDEYLSATFSPDGNSLAAGTRYHTIKVWDAHAVAKPVTLGGHARAVRSAAFASNGTTLASGDGETVRLWDLVTGTNLQFHEPSFIHSVAFSHDGKVLAEGGENEIVTFWDVSTGRQLRTLKTGSWIMSLAFSPDDKTLATGMQGRLSLWDLASGTELHDLRIPEPAVRPVRPAPHAAPINTPKVDEGAPERGGTPGLFALAPQIHAVSFSPDGRILASAGDGFAFWDVATGAALYRTSFRSPRFVVFSPDNKTIVIANEDGTIRLLETATQEELRVIKGSPGLRSLALRSDGKHLATGRRDGKIRIWEVSTGRAVSTLSGHSLSVEALAFSADGKILASGSSDATIKLWDAAREKELAKLIALDQSDWLVITPDGLFDGSPAAWKQILWRFNNNTFDYAPVEAFFKEYWRPGLVQQIMSGARPQPPDRDLSKVDIRQPQVRMTKADRQATIEQGLGQPAKVANPISNRTIEVTVEVADNVKAPSRPDHPSRSGARDLRLFRNGSLVKLWQGDVFDKRNGCEPVSAKPNEPLRAVCKASVSIVAGGNNFSAYAFNNRDVKSTDTALTITGADNLKRKGTLHILAVGVSRYANREYNLNYTTDDATSFASQLKLQQDKLGQYQSIEIKTLLNENATKANILAELKKLAAAVQPEDAVVVYFSGHGKASGDHFYLVPHDLGYTGSRDQLSEDGLRQILTHSISDLELEEAFRGVDAGQMFMIIDACNSGQALENKDELRRGPMNTRGLAQLAYEKGMYILTASQNVEEAFVSERLKHSYLTYALVEEGLKTKVADADRNGEVVLREWFDYALTRVPKLREEVLQTKSLEEVTPKMKAARSQKSQTPRVFYRREPDARPLVVAKP